MINNVSSHKIEPIISSIKSHFQCDAVSFSVEQYRFKSRDEYFTNVSHVWDIATKEPECIEYNQGLFRLNNFSINEDITLFDLEKVFVNCYGEGIKGKIYNPDESFANDPLVEHCDKVKIIDDIKELILNDSHLIEYEDLDLLFSDYCEYSDNIFEPLGYWTTYFEPYYFNEEIAYKCNLTPFRYVRDHEDRELLALGGCGMDLSPKLDAYQAMIDGTIDRNSTLLRYPETDYFSYVVGEENTKEAIKCITRTKEKIIFETYI
jgi:hypothetical protein